MSFTVDLMYNGDEINKIKKNPTSRLALTGTLRDTTSIVDPQILIEYDGVLNNVNYAHISTFNRWYFITDIHSVRTGLWLVKMHCDVLKTYAEGILKSTGVIARQENSYNLYLDDYFFKCYQNPMITTKVFPKGFTQQAFVLAMAGQEGYSSNTNSINSIENDIKDGDENE